MPHHSAHHWIRLKQLNKKQQQQLIRRSVLAIAIIEPIMTLPQIHEVWIKHHTSGVSISTWSLYALAAVIWLLYGLQLKDKPLIISSMLWIIMDSAVAVGTAVYS